MITYKVYMHIFPDHKRYIGMTCKDLHERWNNGMGYIDHNKVFNAICKFGWDNIKHYLLFDGLSKEEAVLIENALILKFKSHHKSYGYNTRVSDIPEHFVIPEYKKQRIKCKKTNELYPIRKRQHIRSRKPVQNVETGEVYQSISLAASCFMVNPSSISQALKNPSYTVSGFHWKYYTED